MSDILKHVWEPGEYLPWMMHRLRGATPTEQAELDAANRAIDAFTKEVDKGIVEGGFAALEEDLKGGGTSTTLGSVDMLSMYSGGRIMLTFNEGDEQVSFVYAQGEHPSRIGLQSCYTSFERAQEIIKTAVDNWDPELVQEDNSVGFG